MNDYMLRNARRYLYKISGIVKNGIIMRFLGFLLRIMYIIRFFY